MKKENARRSKMLHFAVTEEEARIIDAKMKQLEIRNMSAFLRAMVLNGYVLKLDLPQLREMIRLLANLTNNVNQIARRSTNTAASTNQRLTKFRRTSICCWA